MTEDVSTDEIQTAEILTEEEKGVLELYPELARVERRNPNGWREIKSFVLRGQRLKDYQIKALREHFHDYAVIYDENRRMDFEQIGDWRLEIGDWAPPLTV